MTRTVSVPQMLVTCRGRGRTLCGQRTKASLRGRELPAPLGKAGACTASCALGNPEAGQVLGGKAVAVAVLVKSRPARSQGHHHRAQPGAIVNCRDSLVTPPLPKAAWFLSRLGERGQEPRGAWAERGGQGRKPRATTHHTGVCPRASSPKPPRIQARALPGRTRNHSSQLFHGSKRCALQQLSGPYPVLHVPKK